MAPVASEAFGDASIMLANAADAGEVLNLASYAEAAGFTRLWLAENNGLEVASMGAVIARSTSLEVGTAIVPVFNRTPALLAMMANTWAELGERPVHLGIGAGGQVLVADWHGVDFEAPRSTVAETIEIIRQALSGERTSFQGSVRSSSGFRLATRAPSPVYLYVGGMGPRMTRLAGERADGLILTWIPASQVQAYRTRLDVASERRPPGQRPRLLARVYVAVVEDVARARQSVREEMVEYLLSPPYARYFTSIGHGADVEAARRGFEARDRARSAAAVSDDLLDQVLVVGRASADVANRLHEYFRAGADEILVQPVPTARGGDPMRTIAAVAEALRPVAAPGTTR